MRSQLDCIASLQLNDGLGFRLEPMLWRHLDEVVGIESTSFSDPCSRSGFECEIVNHLFSRLQVAMTMIRPSRVVGYGVVWLVCERIYVQNITLDVAYRGRGIGRYLSQSCLQQGKREVASAVELEVRASNLSATNFYRSEGFEIVGSRRGYYLNLREDVVLMELRLD